MTTSNLLANRAMIAYLSISQWSARRLDRDVTDELNRSKGATRDASRVNKLLVPKEALAPITKIARETKDGFDEKTLPWLSDGARVLPAPTYREMAKWVRDQKQKFADAVDAFVLEYPNYLRQAQGELGAMFKPEDYPSLEEIERKFDMKMKILPVPTGDDFRVNLAGEEIAAMRAEMEQSVADAAAAMTKNIFDRIADVANKMVERLTVYKPGTKGQKAQGHFQDSLVTNIHDLVEILPSLNVTDDDRIRDLTARLHNLGKTKPQKLRDDSMARFEAQKEAKRILSMVESWS